MQISLGLPMIPLLGLMRLADQLLARHAGGKATPTTLNSDEPILGFGGLWAINAACWVWTDSVFELGSRARQHNPGSTHRADRSSDPWGQSLHPSVVVTTVG